jgi:Protein of unknown function (DUF3047)
MISRRSFLVAAVVAGSGARPASADSVVVEAWTQQALGVRGVPEGWQPYETPGGRPRYDFEVVEDGGRRALSVRGADDHSTIARRVAVDLGATPILQWSWSARRFPEGADLRNRATSDATGHIFVVWSRFPALLRSRLIGYVWDPAVPAGTVIPSRKAGTVTFVVVRSGAEPLGEWVDTRRDVAADYRTIFGETAPRPDAVALSIDTNDTHSTAEALFGRIAFTRA